MRAASSATNASEEAHGACTCCTDRSSSTPAKNKARRNAAVDRAAFRRALFLAGVLEERSVQHVHAPWASSDAFVALLAARILGVPYTVQARAYDLHHPRASQGVE